jgi:hypothetical protein
MKIIVQVVLIVLGVWVLMGLFQLFEWLLNKFVWKD